MCRFPEMFVVEAVEGGANVVSHPVDKSLGRIYPYFRNSNFKAHLLRLV